MLDDSKLQLTYLMNSPNKLIQNMILTDHRSCDLYKNNYNDLATSDRVTLLKNKLSNEVSLSSVLSSQDYSFENVFGKLIHWGILNQDILSPQIYDKYIEYLKSDDDVNYSIYYSLSKYLIAALLYLGGASHSLLEEILHQRIDDLYQTTQKDKPYNIYEDELNQKNGKNANKKIIRAEYYQSNRLRLPLIYDIFVFYHIYKKASQSIVVKIDAIIDYIASNTYQKLDYGYGLIKTYKSSYHQVGWSVHLPLFTADLSRDYFRKGLLFRMFLFSRFKNEIVIKWLIKNLVELKKYKIDHFRYCFPSTILVQEKNNYFMNGRQMGLSENRRIKESRIIESTYYMYQIQKNMNDLSERQHF